MSDINNLDNWLPMVKEQKMLWVRDQPGQPDMNPTVFVERKQVIRAIIVAPKLDKHQGLYAAKAARTAFAADALTLVFDAHIAIGKPGDTLEDFRKKYPPGSMQRMCDEEGACKTREITDCLICHRITDDGHIQMVTLPYIYHEKYQGQFNWLDEEITRMDNQQEGCHLEGLLPETLADIIKGKTSLDIPQLEQERVRLGLTEDQALYHAGRGMMKILRAGGFLCYHLEKPPYPEEELQQDEELRKTGEQFQAAKPPPNQPG